MAGEGGGQRDTPRGPRDPRGGGNGGGGTRTSYLRHSGAAPSPLRHGVGGVWRAEWPACAAQAQSEAGRRRGRHCACALSGTGRWRLRRTRPLPRGRQHGGAQGGAEGGGGRAAAAGLGRARALLPHRRDRETLLHRGDPRRDHGYGELPDPAVGQTVRVLPALHARAGHARGGQGPRRKGGAVPPVRLRGSLHVHVAHAGRAPDLPALQLHPHGPVRWGQTAGPPGHPGGRTHQQLPRDRRQGQTDRAAAARPAAAGAGGADPEGAELPEVPRGAVPDDEREHEPARALVVHSPDHHPHPHRHLADAAPQELLRGQETGVGPGGHPKNCLNPPWGSQGSPDPSHPSWGHPKTLLNPPMGIPGLLKPIPPILGAPQNPPEPPPMGIPGFPRIHSNHPRVLGGTLAACWDPGGPRVGLGVPCLPWGEQRRGATPLALFWGANRDFFGSTESCRCVFGAGRGLWRSRHSAACPGRDFPRAGAVKPPPKKRPGGTLEVLSVLHRQGAL